MIRRIPTKHMSDIIYVRYEPRNGTVYKMVFVPMDRDIGRNIVGGATETFVYLSMISCGSLSYAFSLEFETSPGYLAGKLGVTADDGKHIVDVLDFVRSEFYGYPLLGERLKRKEHTREHIEVEEY